MRVNQARSRRAACPSHRWLGAPTGDVLTAVEVRMHPHQQPKTGRIRRWFLAVALVPSIGLISSITALAAEPSVYRCTAADGSIEFRQFPCHGRDDSLLLELDDRRSGWTPPDPKTVFTEEPKRAKRDASPRSSKDAAREAAKDAAVDRRWQEKCLKKQHQLDEVKRKLRAGYKASEGQRLRHKRAEYQEYLEKFCD
jgi:hypothetical protein